MSLLRLNVPDEPADLPGDIDTLIRESDARIDAFLNCATVTRSGLSFPVTPPKFTVR